MSSKPSRYDLKGGILIDTKQIALLLQVPEGEVLVAHQQRKPIRGVTLPPTVQGLNKKRQWNYFQVMKAIEEAGIVPRSTSK